jgi:hypothetical protein
MEPDGDIPGTCNMDVGLPAVVETLGNLVFLTSKCADNPELVRIYMTHAERCVSILNQYVKGEISGVTRREADS